MRPIDPACGLAFVDEADDTAGEADAVVGLRTLRIEHGEAPAGGDQLPRIGRVSVGIHLGKLKWDGAYGIPAGMLRDDLCERWILFDEERLERRVDARKIFRRRLDGSGESAVAEHHQNRNGTFDVGGRDERHAEVDADQRIGGVVDVAGQFGRDDGMEANVFMFRGDDGPGDVGDIFGDDAVDVLVEIVDDLRATLLPPHVRSGDFLSIVECERIGQIGPGVGLRLVVICVVGSFRISAGAGAQGLDAELVHHILMVLIGGEGDRRGSRGTLCECN